MSAEVIQIHQLSKQYRLGQIGTTTIRDDFKKFLYRVRGKEDPFLKLGEENDRSKKGNSNLVWALKDISFSVNQGDVLGIVGKNGAGKSTLLKILSRTTSPTTGEYRIKGRVASLLEVGTGFHPDLTGRENVFLNGAILGMTKAEIKKNFDEIVSFSGVERYIDTPVKRYSSGMYVRLAFAVAAHLESEILIVDEVLAVGDQEFQEKCLGKMRSVSETGRTILFVSHNLIAVKQLCTKGLFLKHGTLKKMGGTTEIIEDYIMDGSHAKTNGIIPNDQYRDYSTGEGFFRQIQTADNEGNNLSSFAFNQPFKIKLKLEVLKKIPQAIVNVNINNIHGETIIYSAAKQGSTYTTFRFEEGVYDIEVLFGMKLLPNTYNITIGISHQGSGLTIDWLENIHQIKVDKISYKVGEDYPWDVSHGYIEPEANWQIQKQ